MNEDLLTKLVEAVIAVLLAVAGSLGFIARQFVKNRKAGLRKDDVLEQQNRTNERLAASVDKLTDRLDRLAERFLDKITDLKEEQGKTQNRMLAVETKVLNIEALIIERKGME